MTGGVAFTHPRGATFLMTIKTGIDLSGATIKSQIRSPVGEALIADLTVTPIDLVAGTFTLQADSVNWPIGQAIWDIQITESSGVILYSDLVLFSVSRTATR